MKTEPQSRRCSLCGDDEIEDCANMTHCHECDRIVCLDNCVEAYNDEHGLDFCHDCVEKGLVWIEDEEEED